MEDVYYRADVDCNDIGTIFSVLEKSIIKNGYMSEKYDENNTKYFKSRRVNKNMKFVKKAVDKISKLYELIAFNRSNIDWLNREYNYIDNKGIHCVYISIILKLILEEKLKEKRIDFVQGVVAFDHNDSAAMLFGKHAVQFHAWCTIDDKVLDCTFVPQQRKFSKCSFDNLYILGVFPKDLSYVGHVESDRIVQKYINDFLQINHFTKEEWISKFKELLKIDK